MCAVICWRGCSGIRWPSLWSSRRNIFLAPWPLYLTSALWATDGGIGVAVMQIVLQEISIN